MSAPSSSGWTLASLPFCALASMSRFWSMRCSTCFRKVGSEMFRVGTAISVSSVCTATAEWVTSLETKGLPLLSWRVLIVRLTKIRYPTLYCYDLALLTCLTALPVSYARTADRSCAHHTYYAAKLQMTQGSCVHIYTHLGSILDEVIVKPFILQNFIWIMPCMMYQMFS